MKRGIIALVILGLCLALALPALAASERSEKNDEIKTIIWTLGAGDSVDITSGRAVRVYLDSGATQAMVQQSNGREYTLGKHKQVDFKTTSSVKITCTMIQPKGAFLKVRASKQ